MTTPAARVARLSLRLEGESAGDLSLSVGRYFNPVALSPDGARLVFQALGPKGHQLFLRELSGLGTKALPGTENAFLRIYWMLLGPIVVVVSAMIIAGSDGFSWRDVLPWAAGVLLVVARYVDVTRYGGTTADGEPATTAHARRSAAMGAAITVGAWLSAHAIRLAFAP